MISADRSQVTEDVASDVHLVFAIIATLLSIALFILSKFVIGTVCLVCVGMYVVNFGLLLVTWRSGLGDAIGVRVVHGVNSVLKFPLAVLGMGVDSKQAWGARRGFVSLIILLVATWASPAFMMTWLQWRGIDENTQQSDSLNAAVRSAEYVDKWLAQPPADLNLTLRDGIDVDYNKGPALAPIRIVEFADFECPACRRFFQTFNELENEYSDSIHFVYRNYPLDNECNPSIEHIFHRGSCYSSKFARCAGEQGKFWQAAEFLATLDVLEEQPTREQAQTAIDGGVTALRLDSAAMKECMASKRHDEKILDDIREANALGLQSTPSIWINSRKLDKPTPQGVRAVIEYILKGTERN